MYLKNQRSQSSTSYWLHFSVLSLVFSYFDAPSLKPFYFYEKSVFPERYRDTILPIRRGDSLFSQPNSPFPNAESADPKSHPPKKKKRNKTNPIPDSTAPDARFKFSDLPGCRLGRWIATSTYVFPLCLRRSAQEAPQQEVKIQIHCKQK